MKEINMSTWENMGEFMRRDSWTIYECEYCGQEFTSADDCAEHELIHLFEECDNYTVIINEVELWNNPAFTYAELADALDNAIMDDCTIEIIVENLDACKLFMAMAESGIDLPTIDRTGYYQMVAGSNAWQYGHCYQYRNSDYFYATDWDDASVKVASDYGYCDNDELMEIC